MPGRQMAPDSHHDIDNAVTCGARRTASDPQDHCVSREELDDDSD
jgi:hypothetical protein